MLRKRMYTREAKKDKPDYDVSTGEGQKRLMYDTSPKFSDHSLWKPAIKKEPGEYGHDPILDDHGNPTGRVRMVPSGRIVDVATGKTVKE